MTYVLALAVLCAVLGFILAGLFAWLWTGEMRKNVELRSTAVDWEGRYNAAQAAAGAARSEAKVARRELDDERRARLGEREEHKEKLTALRDAYEVQGREIAALRREMADVKRGRG